MSFAQKLLEVFVPPKDDHKSAGNAPQPEAKHEEQTEGKKKPLTSTEAARIYGRPSSFVQKLPWYEFQTESQTILLDDGKSVGAVFDIVPIATEGRSYNWLQDRRDIIQDALQDCFEELSNGPWIIQQYTYDDDNMEEYIEKLRAYPKAYCKDSNYTNEWLDIMEAHLRGSAKRAVFLRIKKFSMHPGAEKFAVLRWLFIAGFQRSGNRMLV